MEKSRIKAAFILLAAGSARRMGKEKLLLPLAGKTPVALCAAAIAQAQTEFTQIVVAVSPATEAEARGAFPQATLVNGGKTRVLSVKNALAAVKGADYVAIHDAARCLVTPRVIDASMDAAIAYGSGIAAIKARDTVRFDGTAIDREKVMLAQTPQSFALDRIMRAYGIADDDEATDDCTLYERAGYTPYFSEGELQNQKLTYPQDIGFFEAVIGGMKCE